MSARCYRSRSFQTLRYAMKFLWESDHISMDECAERDNFVRSVLQKRSLQDDASYFVVGRHRRVYLLSRDLLSISGPKDIDAKYVRHLMKG